jgi:hypothetical protein
MKQIKNIDKLTDLLSNQDINWQELIYNKTGIILLPIKSGPLLFSNCGYIDLSIDVGYEIVKGEDKTEYIYISSIEEMIEYILEMPSYKEYLVDCSYGRFSKSELFWGIYSRVISAPQNLALSKFPGDTVYGLYTIGCHEQYVDLDMAAIAYNAMSIWLTVDQNTTLNEALDELVVQLNDVAKDTGEPMYINCRENQVIVPSTYDDMIALFKSGAEFAYLNNVQE